MRGNECRILETSWLGDGMPYSGSELRSHFVREAAGIRCDGVVAFTGPCGVEGARLVDLEDAESGSIIRAERMLHFIGEHFQVPLREANYRLRLFAAIAGETACGMGRGATIRRDGDDLFVGERKLSVAIATVSPTSALFHFGVNLDPSGAPVPAVGLDELGLEAEVYARAVMERYRDEIESVEVALRKVRGVP